MKTGGYPPGQLAMAIVRDWAKADCRSNEEGLRSGVETRRVAAPCRPNSSHRFIRFYSAFPGIVHEPRQTASCLERPITVATDRIAASATMLSKFNIIFK